MIFIALDVKSNSDQLYCPSDNLQSDVLCRTYTLVMSYVGHHTGLPIYSNVGHLLNAIAICLSR